ncbi:MAG: hypothetical protein WD016_13745 [Balneolaceae bacterium]
MEFEQLYAWFMGLGEQYGVNPIIFGSIYVGAIPIFFGSLYWLARNVREKKSVAAPALLSCGCWISSYVYLIIAGENVPLWVYGIIISIIAYGIYSTLKKVVQKRKEILMEEGVNVKSADNT